MNARSHPESLPLPGAHRGNLNVKRSRKDVCDLPAALNLSFSGTQLNLFIIFGSESLFFLQPCWVSKREEFIRSTAVCGPRFALSSDHFLPFTFVHEAVCKL